MRLFDLVNNQPIVNAECLLIDQFNAIVQRDKTKDKSISTKELAYVYFSTDYKSLYKTYSEEIRSASIVEDLKLPASWLPDEVIHKACDKYKELQKTPTLGFLEDALKGLDATRAYFANVDYNLKDRMGKPIYDITKVMNALSNCSKVVDSVEKLKEKVEKEQSINENIRGGGRGGELEFDGV